jgi:LPS sulfotransferase NodH
LRRLDASYAGLLAHDVFDRVFPGMRYVQITRRDKVRQAVSWAKASLTNEWFHVSPETPRQGPPPEYDFALIDYYYHEVLNQERRWKAFFAQANVEPFQVVYEDFPANWEAIARALLEYAGVPKHPLIFHASPERRPQRDGIDAQWAGRYREECLERGVIIDAPAVNDPPLLAVNRKR